jgi:hypothetical protein
LSHFADSAVHTLPGKMLELAGVGGVVYKFFEPEFTSKPSIVAVTDLAHVDACPIVWRSWAWQQSVIALAGTLPIAIRAFAVTEAEPMFAIACKSAFWTLSKTLVIKLAKTCGVVVPSNKTLFETLFSVIQLHLHCDDETTLGYISKRLSLDDVSQQFAPGLLEIDAAIHILDKDDHKQVVLEQETVSREAGNRKAFVGEYKAKHVQIRAERQAAEDAAVAAKGKPKGKGKGKGKGKPPPLPPALPSTITQATAKLFVPQGCTVWRGVVRCEWCGHCPPYKRVQSPWSVYTELGSLKIVLKLLWDQHCELRGLNFEDACSFHALLA